MSIGHIDLEEAAQKAAGNWQDFTCFVWWRTSEIAEPENWAVIYTHHRDSGLLDLSNAAVIEKTLKPFAEGNDPDLVFESHHHWLVDHVDGFSIRVFREGKITEAFTKYHDLAKQLDNYPVLDETDYSNREYDATVENIDIAAWKLKQQFELPEGWAHSVYGWLSEHMESEIENVDDQGGWPSEEALATAFVALGFVRKPAVEAKACTKSRRWGS